MIQLGILADDLTGGMMVASLLEREGVECPLVTSIEGLKDVSQSSATAVVVARKIRLIEAGAAAQEAIKTVQALKAIGCSRFYYKYCATFDSTDQGNIGPVAEAMLEAAGGERTLFCPAFPEYTVTVFQGRMFLGRTMLGDSFKRTDPVTPMTNSDLVEVLQPQCKKKVGLISHSLLLRGTEAVITHISQPSEPDLYIADAADDGDLVRIAELAINWPLTTGADALPIFLARAWQKNSLEIRRKDAKTLLPPSPGGEAFIAGSCAGPTLRQVDHFEKIYPVFRVDVIKAADDPGYVEGIIDWARKHIDKGPIGVSSSADLAELQRSQAALGVEGASSRADRILGDVSKSLFELGVRKFVVAGGETSGQVMKAIGVKKVEVSEFDELSGGYCHQAGDDPMSLVLKAGAIGKEDFVLNAFKRMRSAEGLQ